ncbi:MULTISPECIES: glycosyltransferase family 4 protein [unclassified Thioalkalivibrio]|uniref:glycosyltransferase family 4 protein n=1 Tax=unclassified Thioalkalivibrio TaxID=2621013 RepID=UPI00036F79CC|nr:MULTISPECIES: glycosyltransferase family 4 protein [unclassified Thioalkalivibrio]
MLVIRLVGGGDGGGVFSSEIGFVKALRAEGVSVYGVIVGDGPATSAYRELFGTDYAWLPNFPALAHDGWQKVFKGAHVWRESPRAAERVAKRLPAGQQVCCVLVRKTHLLMVAGALAEHLGIPAFWHVPERPGSLGARMFVGTVLRRYPVHVIANSEFTADAIRWPKVGIVYPGFSKPPQHAAPSEGLLIEGCGVDSDRPVFGSLTRVVAAKAVEPMVRGFSESRAFDEGARLVIAGRGVETRYGRRVTRLIERCGNRQVHLLGEVKDVGRIYRTIDVAVHGREGVEPFGRSVAEGLASGKPVLCCRGGMPGRLVRDGVSGWHIDQVSAGGFRRGFDRAWADRPWWREMGLQGQEDVRPYAVDVQVRRYIEILRAHV